VYASASRPLPQIFLFKKKTLFLLYTPASLPRLPFLGSVCAQECEHLRMIEAP